MKYLVFAIFILAVGCTNDASKPMKEADSQVVDRKSLTEISEQISREILALSDWEVELVLDNGKINDSHPWWGTTLSFNNDGSYVWSGNGMQNKGSATVDSDKNMILLYSESHDLDSEWSIKYRKSIMVWIGTPKFGLQALQMKLKKKPADI